MTTACGQVKLMEGDPTACGRVILMEGDDYSLWASEVDGRK